MKVLFDYQILTMQKFGGVSRYHCELSKRLNSIEGVKCDTPVLFSKNYYYEEYYKVKRYNKYYPKTMKIIKMLNHIYTYLRSKINKYDIIHPTWYDTYIIRSNYKGKLVITIHDMIYELYPELFSESAIYNRKRLIDRADLIITVSQNTKRDLLKIYPDISERKVKVIYESAAVPEYTSVVDGLPSKYILYIGTRKNYKNFYNFYKAMEFIMLSNPEVNLVCVGGGIFDNIEINMIELGIGKGRVFQICVNDYQLNYVYQKAICFVFPSFYEGFGLPILEAFANRCPCVLSNRSSLPEVGGDAALYFNPHDTNDIYEKIKLVLYDAKLRIDLINKGTTRNNLFSWDKAAFQLYQEYCNLISMKE